MVVITEWLALLMEQPVYLVLSTSGTELGVGAGAAGVAGWSYHLLTPSSFPLLPIWQAYADYIGFILTLNEGVKGKKLTFDYKVSEVGTVKECPATATG